MKDTKKRVKELESIISLLLDHLGLEVNYYKWGVGINPEELKDGIELIRQRPSL